MKVYYVYSDVTVMIYDLGSASDLLRPPKARALGVLKPCPGHRRTEGLDFGLEFSGAQTIGLGWGFECCVFHVFLFPKSLI